MLQPQVSTTQRMQAMCEENDPEVFVIVIDTCEKGEQKMTQLGAV